MAQSLSAGRRQFQFAFNAVWSPTATLATRTYTGTADERRVRRDDNTHQMKNIRNDF